MLFCTTFVRKIIKILICNKWSNRLIVGRSTERVNNLYDRIRWCLNPIILRDKLIIISVNNLQSSKLRTPVTIYVDKTATTCYNTQCERSSKHHLYERRTSFHATLRFNKLVVKLFSEVCQCTKYILMYADTLCNSNRWYNNTYHIVSTNVPTYIAADQLFLLKRIVNEQLYDVGWV